MKKLISVLLTVCAIAANTSALADTVSPSAGELDNSRNNIQILSTTEEGSLPGFRPGDTLKFNVSNVTSGKQLTLISYKYGDNMELGNNTVQYINQYTLDANSKTIEYKVRDIQEGIYNIVINANDGSKVATFYYKVGNPKVNIVTPGETSTYYKSQKNADGTYSIAFIGSATLGSNEVSFGDTGIETLGITVKHDKGSATSAFSKNIDDVIKVYWDSLETEGSLTFYYGLTVYNVPEAEINNITAEAVETLVATEGGNAE